MTKATEGAVRAAGILMREPREEIEAARIYQAEYFVKVIDREAVAPAVRELMLAFELFVAASRDSVTALLLERPEAEKVLSKYRHLTQQTDTEGV